MKIIAQPKEWIAMIVGQLQGQMVSWGTNYTAIALVGEDDSFKCGVIYNHFDAENVCGHIAIWPGARLTPAFIRAMFEYPFEQMGKQRITALVHRKNRKAINFVRRLGFSYEGCLKKYFKDGDMMCYGMLKVDCPYLARTPEEMRKAA